MRKTIPILLACTLIAASIAAHAQPAATTTPATEAPADAAALRDIQALGQRLFRLDRAAWVASDTLVAAARGRVDPRVQGWITDERDDGIDVTYVDATPAALYRVSVDAQGQATALDARPPALSPAQVAAARARVAAEAGTPASCSGLYNPIVIPGTTPDSWLVYLLPAARDEDTVPLGGAWRIEVRDGQPAGRRAFTHSCITLDNPPDGEGFAVTHLLDPLPTEIHVFWSLWADKPMLVTTSRGTWAIAHGAIQAVQGAAPLPPADAPTDAGSTATMGTQP